MSEFSLGTYPQSALLYIYNKRDEIQLAPEYQRISGVWNLEKRQLLLDTLLNGFDLPKLYFHEFVPPHLENGKRYRYAIIDGKQRLHTIWDFIDDRIPLAGDFKYLPDDAVEAGGLHYSELAKRYPLIKTQFDSTSLAIVTVRTDDLNLIEDMFSRLNEAVPLNAPEKRNAFGGPLPPAIRAVARHPFFTKHIPFDDARYRHRDLAAKFLFVEHSDSIVNTKKPDLDAFVRAFKAAPSKRRVVADLQRRTERALGAMVDVFTKDDGLLRQVGMITLYYHLFRLVREGKVGAVERRMLVAFEDARDTNRARAEQSSETDPAVNLSLLEFDKHSQTPNDAYAIRIRLAILLDFLRKRFKVISESIARKGAD